MSHLKKLTLLHSNDMHGDFLAEEIDKQLVGGVAMLSGYVSKVRAEEKNVIYAVAGDMFRGSIIDSEFKGVSTVDIMNLLAPDVVGLGNHEMDYSLGQLLFLEKCARFPIINANLYIKHVGTRLFRPHMIIEIDGMKILFIGIVTEEIMGYSKKDEMLGTFIDIHDAAEEIGRIVNSYKTVDIDFTVIITHIGLEEDKKLAALLDPDWGVDVIIGGHSHSFMDEPVCINNILIAQAGIGTDAIGRFDIIVNTDTNSVEEYQWQMVPINDSNCPVDEEMQAIIEGYKKQTDDKYNRIMTRFDRVLTHPVRYRETELGDLAADAISELTGEDIVLIGSGSIRVEKLGRVVTLQDMKEAYPFQDELLGVGVRGADLKAAFAYMLRNERLYGHTEFYQVNSKVRMVYDAANEELTELSICGEPAEDDRIYNIVMQTYHLNNIAAFLKIPEERIERFSHPRVISTSDYEVLEEYFGSHSHVSVRCDGRITVLNEPAAEVSN